MNFGLFSLSRIARSWFSDSTAQGPAISKSSFERTLRGFVSIIKLDPLGVTNSLGKLVILNSLLVTDSTPVGKRNQVDFPRHFPDSQAIQVP